LLVEYKLGFRRTTPKSHKKLVVVVVVFDEFVLVGIGVTPVMVIATKPEYGDLATKSDCNGLLIAVNVKELEMKSSEPANAALIPNVFWVPFEAAIPTESALGVTHRMDLSVRAMHGFWNMEPTWIVYPYPARNPDPINVIVLLVSLKPLVGHILNIVGLSTKRTRGA
jgi:hypothetical protein